MKDTKAQLMTLITGIMKEEAGFMIDEILKDCQRETKGTVSLNTKMI